MGICILAKGRRRWLRRLGRAARHFQRDTEPFAYVELATALEKAPLGTPDDAFRQLPPELRQAALDCLRQKLLSGLMFARLLPALLVFGHRPDQTLPALPLPPAWRTFLDDQGVRLPALGCTLAWRYYLATTLLRGVVAGLRLLWRSWRGHAFAAPGVAHAVLLGASPKMALPRTGHADDWHDFAGWVRQTGPGLHGPVEHVVAAVGRGRATSAGEWLTLAPEPFPRLDGTAPHLTLLARLIGFGLRGLAGALTGRTWWHAVLADQYFQLAYFDAVPPPARARTYAANNSGIVLRPLWTYRAEQAGARVPMVFYSANCEVFHRAGARRLPLYPGYGTNTWPEFVVWSAHQDAFVRRLGRPDVACRAMAPVPLVDRAEPLPPLPERFVAVFDVGVFRLLQLAKSGIVHPYYAAETAQAFFADITAVLAARGLAMVVKAKRDRGEDMPPRIRRLRDWLLTLPDVHVVHPDFAATRVIARAAAVLSMPFTSTALAARAQGVPSAYYDARGWLDGAAAHDANVPTLGGRAALDAWLATAVR